MPSTPIPYDAYYESGKCYFLIRDQDQNWMRVSDRSFMLHLALADYDTQPAKGQVLSAAQKLMLRIQTERNIVYSGPLAGFDAGMHVQSGCKVLVTQSPIYPSCKPGDWSVIQALLEGMFQTPDVDQTPFFHLWLQVADRSFVSKNFVPGPALAMAGASFSGKTLLSRLVTRVLGNRAASPYRYLSGKTEFNSDLLGKEVLILDDETPSKDLRTRRSIGTGIKNMLFAGIQSGHGKNANAVTLRPFWRLLILINDEIENLMVLPPIDESLNDKLILLKIIRRAMPMPATSPDDQAVFWNMLESQIPAYLHFLRHEFKAPAGSEIDPRTGVINYKHPELLIQLSEIAPETHMWSLVLATVLKDSREWIGSQEEITQQLCSSSFAFEARKLLSWPTAAGTYLSRLHKSNPKQVEKFRNSDDERLWRLKR